MLKKTIVTESTVYGTIDGYVFDSAYEALLHEWRLTAKELFIVAKRGADIQSAEVYDTYELAEKHSDENHTIHKMYLNEREEVQKIKETYLHSEAGE